MANFSLSVAAADVIVVDFWHPVSQLLLVTVKLHAISEHSKVKTNGVTLVCHRPLVFLHWWSSEVKLSVLVEVEMVEFLGPFQLDLLGR